MQRPRLVIAGTHSGAGKTTVTLAIMAALQARGLVIQPFKVGPDFIDPGHHQLASGRFSRNLDGWMLGEAINRDIFTRASQGADLSIIEGMMGLFDGSSPVHEQGSTAELAKQVHAPVMLVIDGRAMARSAAAMASGYAKFDPALSVQAVLFNRVQSDGHYRLLRDAVEAETDLTVVGYLRPDASVTIPERHLGLRTAVEQGRTDLYDRLARAAADTVDLDRVEALARSADEWWDDLTAPVPVGQLPQVRIGVAYDGAFCFYYQDNLDLFESAGAEIVRFSPLHDDGLPDVDLLYSGGGYPEIHGEALAANLAMRTAVRQYAERGGAIYAECGGLMYLTQAIRDGGGRRHEMVGIFPAEAVMRKAGLTLGYRSVEVTQSCLLGRPGLRLRGHEFHYSALEPKSTLHYACTISDAEGKPIGQDGLMTRNTVALYSHLHFGSHPEVVRGLVAVARGSHKSASSIGKA